MHNPFSPQCGYCRSFVYCFPASSRLADWGYCSRQAPEGPPPELLRRLEDAASAGRYDLLFADTAPVYQVSDDGCSAYAPAAEVAAHHHGGDGG